MQRVKRDTVDLISPVVIIVNIAQIHERSDIMKLHKCQYGHFYDVTMEKCPMCGIPGEKFDIDTYKTRDLKTHRNIHGIVLDGKYLIDKASAFRSGDFYVYNGIFLSNKDEVIIKEYFPVGISHSDKRTNNAFFQHKLLGRYNVLKELYSMINKLYIRKTTNFFNFIEANNTLYIVLQKLSGKILIQYLNVDNPLSYEKTYSILSPIFETLKMIHSKGYIYGGLSPYNILVQDDLNSRIIELENISKATSTEMSILIREGFTAGEMYSRINKRGPWTDVYSIAAIVYYLLTGILPIGYIDRICGQEIIYPSNITPQVKEVLKKALSPEPKRRYENIELFRYELRKAMFDTETIEPKDVNNLKVSVLLQV